MLRIGRTAIPVALVFWIPLAYVYLTRKDSAILLAMAGAYLGLLIGLMVSLYQQEIDTEATVRCQGHIAARITSNPELCGFWDRVAEPLARMYTYQDPLFRKLAKQLIGQFIEDLRSRLSLGKLRYATEAWREPLGAHSRRSQSRVLLVGRVGQVALAL